MIELVDYPVTYDDLFYFSYPLLPSIPVLTINGKNENQYLNLMFRSDSSFRYFSTSDKKVDYGSMHGYPLVILNGPEELSSGLMQEFIKYLLEGGTLLVLPPENIKSDTYRTFLTSLNAPVFINQDTNQLRISELALESDIFSDIFEQNGEGKINIQENSDFPLVFKHYTLGNTAKINQEVLIKLQNGHAFLSVSSFGKGRIYLFASPLDEKWTNFPKHLLFLPTLFKIALMSIPSPELYYSLGSEPRIELASDTLYEKKMVSIRKNNADFEMIPETRAMTSRIFLFPHDQIKDPGWYSVYEGKERRMGLAFNYNRCESDLKCFTPGEIREQLTRFMLKNVYLLDEKKTPVALQLKEINQGTPVWKYFILLTLLFLITEILLIRLMKS